MRRRARGEIDVAAAAVGARYYGCDAHVEIGVGFSLAAHPGETINQARNNVFSGAVDDASAFRNRERGAGSYIGNAPVLHDDDGVGLVFCGSTPIRDVNQSSTLENEGNNRCLRATRQHTQQQAADTRQQQSINSHKRDGLLWIVARTPRSKRSSGYAGLTSGLPNRDSKHLLLTQSKLAGHESGALAARKHRQNLRIRILYRETVFLTQRFWPTVLDKLVGPADAHNRHIAAQLLQRFENG